MASGVFARLASRRILVGGAAVGAAGLAGNQILSKGNKDLGATAAEIQFHTSYGFIQNGQQLVKPPEGWTERLFEIRNDYPALSEIKSKGVVVAKDLPTLPGPDTPIYLDPIEDAPWLNIDFRKNPLEYCAMIKAYCWEGNVNNDFVLQKNRQRRWPTLPYEFAKTQKRQLQTWACGYYNEIGAATFGDIWKDPNNPKWENVKFPLGSCVFKILLTDAKDAEVSTMKGAPSMQAVISPEGANTGSVRLNHASSLRLLQVDFAVRDDRADIGWVFGTFMYNGDMSDNNPWDRIIPVGIMWADNFRSACASCHSVSERDHTGPIKMVPNPKDPVAEKMRFFRNIPAGQSFDKDNVSGDYSLQLMMGYNNFLAWRNAQKGILHKTMLVVPFSKARKEAEIIESIRQPLRSTPEDREEDTEK
ncbi:hypothetical protein NKR23_g11539 [Pleurostoma richardsiae]|uniref:Cytochrome c domain-containing protein n=1 Tax=Pleurostoma richardsiae TaxID=41990 RepID=A0AA38VBD5_9PEZI|nr:hypothetical protein NKR23_g11539 [Pleurostoma richardsiae]